jgi:hypothetical protein
MTFSRASLRFLLVGPALVFAACGPLNRPAPVAPTPGGVEGLDHEYAFTSADFGIPDEAGRFGRANPLGQIAGYEVEAKLVAGLKGDRAGYALLFGARQTAAFKDGQFEVTATATCEGDSRTEVTLVHAYATEQADLVAHCSGVPKGFSVKSVRFIPDLP